MTYTSKLLEQGIQFKEPSNPDEPVKALCPWCSHTRRKNKSEKCLRVWVNVGTYYCHHCGISGSVAENKTEYELPKSSSTPLSDKVLSFFQERGISKSSLECYGVTEGKEYMPQVQAERNVIQFNYLKDGLKVNIKYRDAQKNFKLHKGSELVIYGLDIIKNSDWCIITEGELDALAFYEAGHQLDKLMFACSVPNGASVGNQNLTYLDNCIDYFENKKQIYIAVDSDAPGLKLRDELCRRLGKDRIWLVDYPSDCKDANDVLMKHGAEILVSCYENAKPYPLEGISKAGDVRKEVHNMYNFGMPRGDMLGFQGFDKLLTFRKSEFHLITGVPGHGKSSFVDQIMVILAKRGWKFGIFSAEKQPIKVHVSELIEKLLGKKFGRKFDDLKEDELDPAIDFINKHFFFINLQDNDLSVEGLLNKGKELVRKEGISGLIIDNWAFVEHKVPRGLSEHQFTGQELSKIKIFKEAYDCAVFLVAHPQKLKKDNEGKVEVASGYSISGSSHFFNKIDNGLTIYRNFEKNTVEAHVWKVRWRFTGQVGMQEFKYDLDTTCYTELSETESETYETQKVKFRGQ